MSFRYHPFYCEENIWWLIQEPLFEDRSRWVLFMTGAAGRTALWHQRAHADGPTVWDYHVVMVASGDDGGEVWDMDTDLGLGIGIAEYPDRTFCPLPDELADFRPRFRLVESEPFLCRFSTDRSHMKAPGGDWLRPPPPWDPPGPSRSEDVSVLSNLLRFIDMSDDIAGTVMSLSELERRFARS